MSDVNLMAEASNVCQIHGQRIEGKECIYCWMDDQAVLSEGHDPDLDENNVCRVCGKYEPE